MARSPDTLRQAGWAREVSHPDSRPGGARLDQFRQRFRHITTATRQHRQAGWIHRPEYQSLRRLSDEGLDLSRLIAQELALLETDTTAALPGLLLEQLLTANEARLQVIGTQLSLIDLTVQAARLLQPLVEGLLCADGLPSTRLRSVLDELVTATSVRKGSQLVPGAGIFLERILAEEGWPHPWFYAATIQQSLWAALLCPGLADIDPGVQRHVPAATLLADVGRLVASLRTQRRHGPAPRGSTEYLQHPSGSAALIAGLQGASVEWAQLAAQHHERTDGSGFPARLAGRGLPPRARCLTAIIRWSELAAQSSDIDADADHLLCSADELWRETDQGMFDADVVSRMLNIIRPGLMDDVHAQRRRRNIRHIEPAHALAGPAFLSAGLPAQRLSPIVAQSQGFSTRR